MKTVFPARAGVPFAACWLVDAAWAHPFWNQYVVELCDLTTETSERPTVYAEGMTHEVVVTAIQKEFPLRQDVPLSKQEIRRLTPPNHAYQFRAESDEAATWRIDALIDKIHAKQLSPDTDARRVWDHVFRDGVSLCRSGAGLVLDAVLPTAARAG